MIRGAKKCVDGPTNSTRTIPQNESGVCVGRMRQVRGFNGCMRSGMGVPPPANEYESKLGRLIIGLAPTGRCPSLSNDRKSIHSHVDQSIC